MSIKNTVYQAGNEWQKKVYLQMSNFLSGKGVKKMGVSKKGNQYKHLLTEEEAHHNFVNNNILSLTKKRFEQHKAGDLNRILTNTAASQPYCFNLFVHLNENKTLANVLFSHLFNKVVTIQHIEPEFTPNQLKQLSGFELNKKDESIGDQTDLWGTDADVAIFYTYEQNKKGVLLIEFKFIEAEFSLCSSYKKKDAAKLICNTASFYQEMILDKKTGENKSFLCGYNKYENWQLTQNSAAFDVSKIKNCEYCPFRFGLNQLWRNMLLAEKVAAARSCDEYGFWVFSPMENDKYLWKEQKEDVEVLFREVLTENGNKAFKKIHLDYIFEMLEIFEKTEIDKEWLDKMKEKYLIK